MNKRNAKRKTPARPEPGTVTFSTRLTEEQRDRVTAAAELRGWTPSNLIRVAALEKATHILNTSRQTRFDFKGLANKVARQLVNPGAHQTFNGEPVSDSDIEQLDCHPFDLEPEAERLITSDIQILRQASRLAGAELLNLILDICESLTAPDRKDLPEPIEPV